MAAVKGVVRTLMDTTAMGVPDRASIGQVKFVSDSYDATALEAGSTITVCKDIPIEAPVVDVILAYDALGVSSTLQVGDAADPNRYITAVDTSSAGVTRLNAITGIGFANTANTPIVITTAGAAITGTIAITVFHG